jgi:hypothetical protein
VVEFARICGPTSAHVDFVRVTTSHCKVELVHGIIVVRKESGVSQFNGDYQVVSTVKVSGIPVVSTDLQPSRRREALVLLEHRGDDLTGVLIVERWKFSGKLLQVQPKALVSIVDSHFEVEHQVPVVVSKEEGVVLTSSGVVGDELIIQTARVDLIVSAVAQPVLTIVSIRRGAKGRQDSQHLQTPKVLLPGIGLQPLDVHS